MEMRMARKSNDVKKDGEEKKKSWEREEKRRRGAQRQIETEEIEEIEICVCGQRDTCTWYWHSMYVGWMNGK